ncbi:MAG: leucine-rich repeat domain-containing protein, partial [Gammaproteobacteria bacterium]
MSKLALQLIAENKKTRSPFLDLGNCGLTEVPIEIGELVWLEELSFASEWVPFDLIGSAHKFSQNKGGVNDITQLTAGNFRKIKTLFGMTIPNSPFFKLINLKRLYLNHGSFEDISPLSSLAALQQLDISNTRITDLSPLICLVNLQNLDISFTRVDDLSPLSNLMQLKGLIVSSPLLTDLSPLAGLLNLQYISVSNTRVMDLSSISGLINLQSLNVSNTPVRNLSALSNLTNLQLINVSSTRVIDLSPLILLIKKDLPVKSSKSLGEGKGIFVADCNLKNPPAEIVKQGNAAILNYFDEKAKQGTDHLYEAKMLIIGDGGAGKTTLLRRLYQPGKPMPGGNETTKGIDIHRHDFKLAGGRNFRLNVWDFGGQEIYHATQQFFLTKRSLYVLVDDSRKNDKSVHDPAFKYWLEVADLLGDHSPVLIFQNEKGGRSNQIDESGIKGKFGNVKDVYRGNLEDEGSADALCKAVEFHAQNLPHIGEELPAKWVDIRADIEKEAG